MASKLGRTVLIVVEKFSELALIAETAKKMGVRPRIGMRVKLAAKGSGRWEASGGDRSKFGLSTREVVEAINFLRANDLLSCFELLHFHLGSQISAIRAVKNALREAGRFYVEVVQAGRAAQVLRRGRRPGRRLRRLADQLRVVDELHHAGVRERHRVLAAGDLRRSRRAAPDHRHRVGARGRRAPLDAGDRHPGRRRVRRRQGARASSPRDAVARRAEPVRDLQGHLAQEPARGVPRRARVQGRGAAALQPGQPVARPSASSPRTSSGRSARRSSRSCASCARCPRSSRASSARCRTRTSATSRCSSRCPTSGRSISCSRSCRSTGWTRSRRGGRCWPTSPATPTARSITSSTGAT